MYVTKLAGGSSNVLLLVSSAPFGWVQVPLPNKISSNPQSSSSMAAAVADDDAANKPTAMVAVCHSALRRSNEKDASSCCCFCCLVAAFLVILGDKSSSFHRHDHFAAQCRGQRSMFVWLVVVEPTSAGVAPTTTTMIGTH